MDDVINARTVSPWFGFFDAGLRGADLGRAIPEQGPPTNPLDLIWDIDGGTSSGHVFPDLVADFVSDLNSGPIVESDFIAFL